MNIKLILITGFAIITTIGIMTFAATITSAEIHNDHETKIEVQNELDPVNITKKNQLSEITVQQSSNYDPNDSKCQGNAKCISGIVTRIIDGDTIVVGDKSIRFALVNTPEWGDEDYEQAGNYIETICPVGSKVLVDEDDGQTQGSFGRIIGKIYCNGVILNEEILESGHAKILTKFCSLSEFAYEHWAQKFGC